jgi:hypothetical protein
MGLNANNVDDALLVQLTFPCTPLSGERENCCTLLSLIDMGLKSWLILLLSSSLCLWFNNSLFPLERDSENTDKTIMTKTAAPSRDIAIIGPDSVKL